MKLDFFSQQSMMFYRYDYSGYGQSSGKVCVYMKWLFVSNRDSSCLILGSGRVVNIHANEHCFA